MQQDNQFQFFKSRHIDQVTVLQAAMSDFSYGKHAHEEFSFGVTLTGRQDFFANRAFHRSSPGHVIVFNPEDVHDGCSGVDDVLQYRMLYIHPVQLEPLLICAGINSSNFRISDTLLDDQILRQHILKMVYLIESPVIDKLQQESQLYEIAKRIAQYYGEYLPDQRVSRVDSLLLRAKDFIHENITAQLDLDEISGHISLSKFHFLRLFRQQFGMTPHQYILNCRVNCARNDLASGKQLDDVVFTYGFSDLSHFNRRFKPVFGMTPRQYQQLLLNT